MATHKRTSSMAGNESTVQPPSKHWRHEAYAASVQPPPRQLPPTSKPRCIFVVQQLKRPRPTGDWRDEEPEAEKTVCGTFVSLMNANCEVRRMMKAHMSDWNLDPNEDDSSMFDEGSDHYHERPSEEGTQVGSSWEYEDDEHVQEVHVYAYPLTWPEDYDMSDSDEDEVEDEEADEVAGTDEAEGEEDKDEAGVYQEPPVHCRGTGCGQPACTSC